MNAKPSELGQPIPNDVDNHTTGGKLADLERRLDEAVHAGSAKAFRSNGPRDSRPPEVHFSTVVVRNATPATGLH